MATYVNNLRLKEIATGAESGTWGTSTNTNLELIADALGSGTEAITTNADAHTTTVADGAADEGRALFMKYTGTLDSACTITLAPNTINKVWFIENATSGSQNIIISQGSGANITIAPGKIAVILTDGAGSGAAVLDALADLELSSTLSVAGASTLTGVTTHGGNVVSDTDSTDDLGTTGVRWANLWVDAITMGGTLAGAVSTFSSTVGITGITTHGDDVVSDTDSTDDLGTTSVRWANLYIDDVIATTSVKPGTLVLGSGSITDTSGAITFVNENLVTTGTLGSGALTAGTISGTTITGSGALTITNTGSHAIGGAINATARLSLLGAWTSGGDYAEMIGTASTGALTAANGDTDFHVGQRWGNTITCQAASESVAVVAQAMFVEPTITQSGATLPLTATVYIKNAPTEGTISNALHVAAGSTQLQGSLLANANTNAIGGAVDASSQLHMRGSLDFSGVNSSAQSFQMVTNLIPKVGYNGFGMLIAPTFTEAGSGNHVMLATARFNALTTTAGSATITNTSTVYIAGAATATVSGTNYSLWVDAGPVRMDGLPTSDPSDAGQLWSNSGVVTVSAG